MDLYVVRYSNHIWKTSGLILNNISPNMKKKKKTDKVMQSRCRFVCQVYDTIQNTLSVCSKKDALHA